MDDNSIAVIRFLEALQSCRTELGELRTMLLQQGAKNAIVGFNLGIPFRVHKANSVVSTLSGTVSLGLQVVPRTGDPKDFEIEIRWNRENWYIDTEISLYDHEVNYRLLRAFPQRRTASLDECIRYISAAIEDFRRSDELWSGIR